MVFIYSSGISLITISLTPTCTQYTITYYNIYGHVRGVAPYFEIYIFQFLGHSVHNGSPWSNRLSSDQQISGGCGETL